LFGNWCSWNFLGGNPSLGIAKKLSCGNWDNVKEQIWNIAPEISLKFQLNFKHSLYKTCKGLKYNIKGFETCNNKSFLCCTAYGYTTCQGDVP